MTTQVTGNDSDLHASSPDSNLPKLSVISSDNDVLACGRCGERTLCLAVLKRLGEEVIFVDDNQEYRIDPNDSDQMEALRMGNDVGTRKLLAVIRRVYVDTYNNWLRHEAGIERLAEELEHNDYEAWYRKMMNPKLADEEQLDQDDWADERVIIGGALYHDVNVFVYRS